MFHLSRKLDEIQSLTLSGPEGRGVTPQLPFSETQDIHFLQKSHRTPATETRTSPGEESCGYLETSVVI